MHQVYISSTYQDLIEFREVAAQAVRRLQCRAVAMEDYLASDQRPLDKCLADVRASHTYIGIFAWRYGFVPDGHQKSITQLEYEAAVQAGIPCLIFILDDEAEWPDEHRDPEPALINQFRSTLQNDNLRSVFTNVHTLDARVTASLSLHLRKRGESAEIDIPSLLPYMADRSIQREQIADAWSEHQGSSKNRPFMMMVHGSEHESHRAFRDRLVEITFPQILQLSEVSKPVHPLTVEWPKSAATATEKISLLKKRIAESVTGRRDANLKEIAQELNGHQCPVLLSTSIYSETWQSNDAQLIKLWCEFWQDWPDSPHGQWLILVVNFVFKDPSNSSFFTGLKLRRNNKQVRKFIDNFSYSQLTGLSISKLDELQSINERHVLDWLKRDAGMFCKEAGGKIRDPLELAENFKPWIREKFKKSDSIPMDSLARQLREQLRKYVNEGRG